MINAIQEAIAPVGQTCVYNRADGFGYVTPARECGPINRGDAPGVSAMRTYSIITSCGLLAAVISSAAQAAVVEFTWNINPYAGGQTVVGIAAKVNSGRASIQSIQDAQVANSTSGVPGAPATPQAYALPSGWSQQTLAPSFTAGTVTANSNQYGFVRGGVGSSYTTAPGANLNSNTGGVGIGYTVTCLLDALYTPANGDTINVISTMFKQTDGGTFMQTNTVFTFNGTWAATTSTAFVGQPWVVEVSGTFDQLSAAVVPAPGALALLGVAGLAGGRRRRA